MGGGFDLTQSPERSLTNEYGHRHHRSQRWQRSRVGPPARSPRPRSRSRRPPRNELAAVASQTGTETITVITDVRNRADIERLRDRAIEAFGHIDVWINNAGRGITKSVLDITDEDFDEMMLVDTKSALYGMQAIVPHFKERGSGQILSLPGCLDGPPLARSKFLSTSPTGGPTLRGR